MNIEQARKLDHKSSVDVLTEGARRLTIGHAHHFDMAAMEFWEKDRDVSAAYYFKVMAARSYAGNSHFLDAALAYDKAAKDAILSGWVTATMRCRIRACLFYQKFLDGEGEIDPRHDREFFLPKARRNLEFCRMDLAMLVDIYPGTEELLDSGFPDDESSGVPQN